MTEKQFKKCLTSLSINANGDYFGITTLQLSEGLRSIILLIIHSSEALKNGECSSITCENGNMYSHCGNHNDPQQIGDIFTSKFSFPLFVICPRNVPYYHKDTSLSIFIEVLFVIARNWKQLRCPSAEEWIKKLWYIHTIKYYSAVLKHKNLKCVGKYVQLEKNQSE